MINKKLKKAGIILSAWTFLLVSSSCSSDEFIDLAPFNSISEDLAFATAENIDLSIIGVYNAAQRGGNIFGASYVHQNNLRGEDMVNIASFFQITYTSAYDAGTSNNGSYWRSLYALINKANIAIVGLQKAEENNVISTTVRDQYLGEMYFWRAVAHLELLKHFSRPYNYTPDASHLGIPYRTTAITGLESIEKALNVERGTTLDTYKNILADLNRAEELTLSKNQRPAAERITRATKEAVIGFKIRTHLYTREWEKVLLEASKIESSYRLTPQPSGVFLQNYSNTESIFSVENSANTNPGVNGALASIYNGRNLVCISPLLWRDPKWLIDDKRREEGSLVRTLSGVNGGQKFTNKYKDVSTMSDASPILRYSEILLSVAEAHARLGNTPLAIEFLNRVRNRSLSDPISQAYTSNSFSSNIDLLHAIITERRIELLAEGNRWADIHRLLYDDLVPTPGIPAKYANAMPTREDFKLGSPYTGTLAVELIPKDNHRIVWPIPLSTTNYNPILAEQQNPNY